MYVIYTDTDFRFIHIICIDSYYRYFITVYSVYLYIANTKTGLTNEDKENSSYFHNLSIKHMN